MAYQGKSQIKKYMKVLIKLIQIILMLTIICKLKPLVNDYPGANIKLL